MTQEPSEKPKLIIDEDWKTQIQREKEELQQKQAEESTATASQAEAPAAEGAEATQDAADNSPIPPPPPASLPLLITTLATQAMAALGQMPGEDGQPGAVNLDYARHFIDMIAVVEEKSKGNLSTEEQSYITDALHQLRLAYVAIRNQSAGAS